MLWYKGWLETRFRALFAMGLCLFVVFVNRHNSSGGVAGTLTFFWAIIPSACGLAGAGVRTQPAFQAIKGAHGSMYYTLSMPVTRMRLLAVRAALGMLETVVVIGTVCGAAWALIPSLRLHVPIADLLAYFLTVIGCVALFYFLSLLFATFLDAQWLPWAGIFSVATLAWLLPRISMFPSANIFAAMGRSSPLFTHTLPWASMGISLGAAAILFVAAARVMQLREY
jgi:hypothetical protein